jgi:hypothetical protein
MTQSGMAAIFRHPQASDVGAVLLPQLHQCTCYILVLHIATYCALLIMTTHCTYLLYPACMFVMLAASLLFRMLVFGAVELRDVFAASEHLCR